MSIKEIKNREKERHITGGLAQWRHYPAETAVRTWKLLPRRNVSVPHELYRTPSLRQAARTLSAIGENAVNDDKDRLK